MLEITKDCSPVTLIVCQALTRIFSYIIPSVLYIVSIGELFMHSTIRYILIGKLIYSDRWCIDISNFLSDILFLNFSLESILSML